MNYAPLAEHKNNTADYKRAKQLRQTSSPTEHILWNALRLAGKTQGVRFRRQHPIHPYIVDFVCLKVRLVIEIDGMSHDTRLTKDADRTSYLNGLGYEVLRFTNEDVLKNVDGVVATILERATELLTIAVTPLPYPLPQGEGNYRVSAATCFPQASSRSPPLAPSAFAGAGVRGEVQQDMTYAPVAPSTL